MKTICYIIFGFFASTSIAFSSKPVSLAKDIPFGTVFKLNRQLPIARLGCEGTNTPNLLCFQERLFGLYFRLTFRKSITPDVFEKDNWECVVSKTRLRTNYSTVPATHNIFIKFVDNKKCQLASLEFTRALIDPKSVDSITVKALKYNLREFDISLP